MRGGSVLVGDGDTRVEEGVEGVEGEKERTRGHSTLVGLCFRRCLLLNGGSVVMVEQLRCELCTQH